MGLNIRAGRVKVIGKATPPHGLADIGGCPTPGHGVDHEPAGRCEVVKCMCDDRRRDRSGMGNAKSTVVAKGPYVVRRGAKISTEAIAAAQVLVSSVDGLGSGIQLGEATLSSDIARLSKPPDRTCLAIEILAPHFEHLGDCRVGPSPVFLARQLIFLAASIRILKVAPIVGIPTIGVI